MENFPKRLLSLAVAVFMVFSMLPNVSFATTPQSGNPGVTDNLTLDANSGWCPICQDNKTWTLWNGGTIATGGHYYLGSELTAATTISATDAVCLHLNGNNITTTTAAINVTSAATLNVMGSGTVTGASTANSTGAAVNATTGIVNLYSGTYTKTDSTAPVVRGTSGTLNLIGATINDCTANNTAYALVYVTSGAIDVRADATINANALAINSWSSAQNLTISGKVTGKVQAQTTLNLVGEPEVDYVAFVGSALIDATGMTGGSVVVSSWGSFTTAFASKTDAEALVDNFTPHSGITNREVYATDDNKLGMRIPLGVKGGVNDALDVNAENKAWCPACEAYVTWTALSGSAASTQTSSDTKTHFYLTDNYSVSTVAVRAQNANACLHLNGHTLSSTSITVDANGKTLNIMGQGTISSSVNANYYGVVQAQGGGILNILSDVTITKDAAGEKTPLIHATGANSVVNIDGNANIGTSTTVYNGGNSAAITMRDGGCVNMNAGTVYAGNNVASGSAGAVVWYSGAGTFNMQGGVIEGCTVEGTDDYAILMNSATGNVIIGENAEINAATAINQWASSGDLTVSGHITGKVQAQKGITLSGTPEISNLSVVSGAKADATGMTGGNVVVSAPLGVFTTQFTSETSAETVAAFFVANNEGYEIAVNDSFELVIQEIPETSEPESSEPESSEPESSETEVPETDLVIGNNSINAENVTYAYTATADGTLTLTAGGAVMGMVEFSYSVNGGDANVLELSSSVDVPMTAGDKVVVTVVAEGYSSLTAAWAGEGSSEPESSEPESSEPESSEPSSNVLVLGDNEISLSADDMQGITWTFTAAEEGKLTVEVTALSQFTGEMWENVPAMSLGMAFGRGGYSLMINGENAWAPSGSVDVEADDVVQITLVNNSYTDTKMTLNLSISEIIPEVNLNTEFEGNGTIDDPYIIDSLPVDLVFSLISTENDIYFQYTAEEDGTITFTGATCTLWVNDTYSADPITVSAGDVVILNAFEYDATNFGEHSVSIAYRAGEPESSEPESSEPESSEPESSEPESSEPAGPTPVEEGSASADEDSKKTVSFTPTENGTLTITVGDGNAAWVSDVMDFSNFSVIPGASGTAQDTYTIEVVAGVTYLVRFYGPGEPCAAISDIPYSISFTPSGEPVGPQLEDYFEGNPDITEEGTYELAVAVDTAYTTLYKFEPTQTGVYEIELLSGDVDMSLWSTIMYTWTEDAENGILTYTITDLGQSVFIGLSGEGTTAEIKITKTGEASLEPDYDTIDYENLQTPVVFDEDAYEFGDYVDFEDDIIDQAVLGADGYYHLNYIDGPLLAVDFASDIMSLMSAWGYGSVSYAEYAGDVLVSVTDYQNALGEYMMAENNAGIYSFGNYYHLLTDDLIEMLKLIGANNGWYGEDGLVGDTEDAWMFACVAVTPVDGEPDPSVPGTEPSVPGTEPSVPGTEPSVPGTEPSVPGTEPSVPGTEPSVPGTEPSVPGTEPSVPGTEPSVPGTEPEEDVVTKIEITEGGITTVPEALINAGLKTPEEVKEALIQALVTATGIDNEKNVAHYDVTLMYKDGNAWVKADETHFPENGKLTVVIPYPAGTDSTYTFTVAHMFTSTAFGKTPGDVELPKVTNTKDGIQFEVTGLSPITVTWVAPASTPVTGDISLIGMAAALVLSSAGMVATVATKKKKEEEI